MENKSAKSYCIWVDELSKGRLRIKADELNMTMKQLIRYLVDNMDVKKEEIDDSYKLKTSQEGYLRNYYWANKEKYKIKE